MVWKVPHPPARDMTSVLPPPGPESTRRQLHVDGLVRLTRDTKLQTLDNQAGSAKVIGSLQQCFPIRAAKRNRSNGDVLLVGCRGV